MTKKNAAKKTENTGGLTLLNALGAPLGWWGPFYSKKTLNKLSPAEQAPLIKQYYDSMGLDPEKASLHVPKADGFEKYIRSRIKTIDDFKIKTLSDIKGKLPDTDPESVATKKAISDALTLDEKTLAESKKFKKEMETVAAVIKDPKALYSPETMLTYMHTLHSSSQAAMNAQHKKETTELTTALDTHGDTLKGRLQLTPSQYEDMKNEILTTLADSQKKALSDFDKLITEPLKKMHELSKLEIERLFYLSTLNTHNKAMQVEIARKHLENQQSNNPTNDAGVTVEQLEPGSALFKGMKPSDLKTLQTITGRPITKEDTPNGCIFTMNFPTRINFFYHHSAEEKKKADWMGLAGAVRASGYDSITLKFSHGKDEKYAMMQGRIAYEAAREMGFELNKITIEINGKKYTGDKIQSELFKEDLARYSMIDRLAATANEERKKAIDQYEKHSKNDVNSQTFKDTLSKGRALASKQSTPEKEALPRPPSP